jgi:hypothetical protein
MGICKLIVRIGNMTYNQGKQKVVCMQRRSTVGSTRSNGLNTIHISKRLIICSVNAKINTSRKLVHVCTGCTRWPVTISVIL